MSCHPTDESRQDCMIQAAQRGVAFDGCTDVFHQKYAHDRLIELGLLDAGEPHPYVHLVAVQSAEREFSPSERRKIRSMLDLEGAF